jgi:hypothetical protein
LSCILVGLDEHTKGYRCYEPTSKKILVIRDITFDKSKTMAIGALPDGRETPSSFNSKFRININVPDPGNVYNPFPLILQQEPIPDQPTTQQLEPVSPRSLIALISPLGFPDNTPSSYYNPGLSSPPTVYTRRNNPTPPVRRSARISKPSRKVLENYEFLGSIESQTDTLTYWDACRDPLWRVGMDREMDSIRQAKTFTLVTLSLGAKAILSCWIYKIKTGSSGQPDRYKA